MIDFLKSLKNRVIKSSVHGEKRKLTREVAGEHKIILTLHRHRKRGDRGGGGGRLPNN